MPDRRSYDSDLRIITWPLVFKAVRLICQQGVAFLFSSVAFVNLFLVDFLNAPRTFNSRQVTL